MSCAKPTLHSAIFTVLFVVVAVLTIIHGSLGYLENRFTVNQYSLALINEQKRSITQALLNKFNVQSGLDRMAANQLGHLYKLGGIELVEQQLLENLKHFEEVSATFFSTRNNEFGGYIRQEGIFHMYANQATGYGIHFVEMDSLGNDAGLVNQKDGFFAVERPWYQSALSVHTEGFSDVFTYHAYATLALPHSLPVYEDNGTLLGVVGSNIFLGGFGGFLMNQMRPFNGVAVILDDQDHLIASSLDYSPIIALENRSSMVKAASSDNPFVRQAFKPSSAIKVASTSHGGLIEVKVNGMSYKTASFQFNEIDNLNWKVTIFVPEQSFHRSVDELLWQIGSVMAISLLLALLLGKWLASRIALPISRLITRFSQLPDATSRPYQPESNPYELREVSELKSAIVLYQQRLDSNIASLEEQIGENQRQMTQIEQLAVVSRSIDDMSLILSREGKIVWMNRPFVAFFKVDEGHIIDEPITQITGLSREKYDLLNEIYSHLSGTPQGGLPSRFKVALNEARHFECRFFAVNADLQDSILVLIRDISEQTAYEEELDIWKRIFESTKVGIAISWRNNQFVDVVNPAFAGMFGGDVEDYTGYDIKNFYPEDERKKPDDFRRLANEQGGLTAEVELVRKNGERFPVLLSVTFVHNNQGKVLGRVTALSDLTEPKQLQQELFQSQKMHAIGSLAGGIVHDMNNVLAAILGNAELGELFNKHSQALGEAKSKELFQGIIKAAQRGSKLTQQIMSFSRMETMEMTPVAVQKLLTDTIAIVQATLTRDIQLRFESSLSHSDAIRGNESQLQQVLLNLLNNGVKAIKKACRDEGLLILQANIDDDQRLHISVSDNGCGIGRQDQPFIFDPFFTTEPKGKGTGLGLAIVKRIVTAHRGEISLQSSPGEGTRFDLWFENLLSKPETESTDEWANADEQPHRGHIVVVDDEEAILSVWQELLSQSGYRVSAFAEATQALAFCLVNHGNIDCVFTDFDMPNVNGERFCEQIRKHDQDLSIIMATGFGEALSKQKLQELHISALLFKPVALKDLLSELEKLSKDPGSLG